MIRALSPDVQLRVIQVERDSMGTVLQIRACIERGELVAMLGDRVEPAERGRTHAVTLLGGRILLPEAPYLLAGLLDCPLFFMVALREPGPRYRVFAEVLAEKVDFSRGERDKRIREMLRYSRNTLNGGPTQYARGMEESLSNNLDALSKKIGDAAAAMGKQAKNDAVGRAAEKARDLVRNMESMDQRMRDKAQNSKGSKGSQQGSQQGSQNGQ